MKTQNPELELMEEDLQKQIGIIDSEIQSQCPCKCHPHALSCVKCNEAFHRIPIPRHSPKDRRITENGVVYYIA